MKLHLIAGHGHGDNGAYGSGYCEAERVRSLCATIKNYGGDNVIYHDPSHDYYAEDLFKTLNIASDDVILECHMDGWSDPNTRGGHVIIWHDYEPDNYDTALANFIHSFWPGRAHGIYYRDDLKNCGIAAQKGWNYRLAEFGFITCPDDIKKFNDNLDYIAKKVLECFGIGIDNKPQSAPAPDISSAAATSKIDFAESFDNAYARSYTVDSYDGVLELKPKADENSTSIKQMHNGDIFTCYGFYTKESDGTIWLCGSVVINGKTYTGFASKYFLK